MTENSRILLILLLSYHLFAAVSKGGTFVLPPPTSLPTGAPRELTVPNTCGGKSRDPCRTALSRLVLSCIFQISNAPITQIPSYLPSHVSRLEQTCEQIVRFFSLPGLTETLFLTFFHHNYCSAFSLFSHVPVVLPLLLCRACLACSGARGPRAKYRGVSPLGIWWRTCGAATCREGWGAATPSAYRRSTCCTTTRCASECGREGVLLFVHAKYWVSSSMA